MSSVMDDINKRRGGQALARVNGVSAPQQPAAKPMGDQALARVAQGASIPAVPAGTEPSAGATAEQVATAKMLMPAVADFAPQSDAPAVTTPAAPAVEPVTTYTDIAKRMSPELDAEQKAERERRLRNKQQVAAIGDAISALANMHYTGTSGVNAYDPSAALSTKARARYDKFLADVKAYEDAHKAAMLRGEELDAAATEARRQKAEAKEIAAAKAAVEAEERKQKQDNWVTTFNYNKAKDAAEAETKAAEAKAAAKKAAEAKAAAKKAADDNETRKYVADKNAEVKDRYYKGQKATENTLGKVLPFNREKGESIIIYENVWKPNKQQVYDDMLADGVVPPTYDKFDMTQAKIDDFIEKNWQKSPKAVAKMEALSRITPETLPVRAADDVVDFNPNDDVIIDF